MWTLYYHYCILWILHVCKYHLTQFQSSIQKRFISFYLLQQDLLASEYSLTLQRNFHIGKTAVYCSKTRGFLKNINMTMMMTTTMATKMIMVMMIMMMINYNNKKYNKALFNVNKCTKLLDSYSLQVLP